MKVKAKEHTNLQIQNLQILHNLIFFRCTGMTELVYHLFFSWLHKEKYPAVASKEEKIVPLTSCRLCLQSGQLGRWSKQRSIHSLQKVWPHGVVTGSYNILRRKNTISCWALTCSLLASHLSMGLMACPLGDWKEFKKCSSTNVLPQTEVRYQWDVTEFGCGPCTLVHFH